MYVEGVTFGDSNELFCVSVKKKESDLAKLEAFEKCEERIAAGQRGACNWSSGPSNSLLAYVQERIQAHVRADNSAWRRQIKCACATSSECIFSPPWLFFKLSEHPEHQ